MTDTDFILSKAAIAWANENRGLSRATLESLGGIFSRTQTQITGAFLSIQRRMEGAVIPGKIVRV